MKEKLLNALKVLELIYLVLTATVYIVGPVAFYVLGIILNFNSGYSVWWALGIPLLLFIPMGINIFIAIPKEVKLLWKKSKKK